MKPPTPAMIKTLRLIDSRGSVAEHHVRTDTRTALQKRGLIAVILETQGDCYWRRRWHITDAGRRVLAAQEPQ